MITAGLALIGVALAVVAYVGLCSLIGWRLRRVASVTTHYIRDLRPGDVVTMDTKSFSVYRPTPMEAQDQ